MARREDDQGVSGGTASIAESGRERTAEYEGATGQPQAGEQMAGPLLPSSELDDYRGRWEAIQARFVDAPRESVQEADGLVAEIMRRLAQVFSEERRELEGQWDRGGEVSTEDLRVALQRYRSFFQRLLAA